MTGAETTLVGLEEQLYTTADALERHRLFQLLIEEVVKIEDNFESTTIFERRIAENNERYERQKELVARLKRDGRFDKDGYFLLVTLKTMQALFCHHYARARKIPAFVVPRS